SNGNSNSDTGSDSKDKAAESQATPTNKDPDKDGDNDLKKTAVPPTTETGTTTTTTTTPVTPQGPVDAVAPVPPVGPIVPIPTIKGQTPDKSCAFHPESPKCMPDKDGNCPSGFSHNSKGNCFPSGSCPAGFGRHDNDENGKCFRTGPQCPHGFHMKNGRCNKDITITVHTHSSGSSSSGSSYRLSDSMRLNQPTDLFSLLSGNQMSNH
ncbi:MAG: hypothetical protein WBP64_10815, partial [Nitrososphaeraceae archaeon]